MFHGWYLFVQRHRQHHQWFVIFQPKISIFLRRKERSLFWIQLNESFPVEGPLADDFVRTRSSSTAPYMGGGAFWTDLNQTTLYSFAGFSDGTMSGQSTISSYEIANDTWATPDVAVGAFNRLNRANGRVEYTF